MTIRFFHELQRDFTMVYTRQEVVAQLTAICNSRNFTMVYTLDCWLATAAVSAIAEILLWFTPRWA